MKLHVRILQLISNSLMLLWCIFLPAIALAIQPNWTPVPNLQYNMQVTSRLTYSDGTYSNNPADLVAAFVGQECRGVASPSTTDNGIIFLTVGADVEGEVVSYKAWLADWDIIVELNQTINFVSAWELGDLASPFIFSFDAASDSEGNVYTVVSVGSQQVMGQNLRSTYYRNGTSIPTELTPSEWTSTTQGAYVTNSTKGDEYGLLYNYYAVSNDLCPEGWHVPTDQEWKNLEIELGMDRAVVDYSGWRGTVQGGQLKSTGTIENGDGLWYDPNTGANNYSGMEITPGGIFDGSNYDLQGYYAYIWTATSYDENSSQLRQLSFDNQQVGRDISAKTYGFSVRCFKDIPNDTVAYYSFTGNSNDESGNENNPYYTNVSPTDDRFGNANSAITLNGVDNNLTIPHSTSLDIIGEITVSAWINPSRVDLEQQAISSKGGGWSRAGWLLTLNNDKVRWHLGDGSTESIFDTETSIPANKWTNVVATWKDGVMQVYINGILDNNSAVWENGLALNTYDHYIGKTDYIDFYFNGKIDDVAVYNFSLSPTQVAQNYANYSAPHTLVAEPGDGQVTLRWSDERMSEIQRYEVYQDGVHIYNVSNSTVYTITGLNNHQLYSFYIQSVDFYENISQPSTIVHKAPSATVVADIDGNVYPTVIIGTQEWMAENLMVMHYNSGEPISAGLDNAQWVATIDGALAIYPHADIDGFNSDTEVLEAYGALYNWFAVNDSRNICPAGWRVPAWEEDWNVLESFMYPESGAKLKSTRTYPLSHPRWDDPNSGATNEVGFSALPSGIRFAEGSYAYVGQTALWWTSTIDENPWFKNINYNQTGFNHGTNWGKNVGFSVRCIKDSGAALPLVSTSAVTNITQTTATSGGNVTNDGGASVTARGICWSTFENPTIADSKTEDGTGVGEFTSSITGLTANITYYVRAYATNSIGTAYGQEENFATTSTSTFTVYFSNPQMWENVYLWTWGGDGSFTSAWPGALMNAPAEGSIWYSFDIPESYNYLLFNAGDGADKTIDLFRNSTGWFDGIQWYDSEPYNTQGTLSDIDGNFYRIAAIGNQIWMAQNLRVKRYSNGDDINANLSNNDWSSTDQGAIGVYPPDNIYFYSEDGMLRLYGAQYNWYAVSDGRNICPTGWRIPSNDDWDELIAHLGGASEAGGKLKTTGNIDSGTGVWVSPNTGATNEVGFLAAPSGSREYSGTYYNFSSGATFWSSTQYEYDAGYFYGLNLNYATAFAEYAIFMKNQGLSVRCVLGSSATAPTVITYSVDGITSTSAVSGGNVTNNGGAEVTARGVVWSTGPSPTLESNIGYTTDGAGDGEFVSELSGLSPETTYYVRAYATNSEGTGYGEQVSFTSLAEYTGETVTDADGNVYPVVEIGTQKWTAENLKTIHYSNGDNISAVTDPYQWINQTTGAFSWYGNGTYGSIYGALYNWYAVIDSRNVCPAGWHVPTDKEWKTLEMFLGLSETDADAFGWRGSDEGSQLKNLSGWNEGGNGSNSSGFSALPGGRRLHIDGSFDLVGENGYWWSSTATDAISVYHRNMNYYTSQINRGSINVKDGYSVRCIKNKDLEPNHTLTISVTDQQYNPLENVFITLRNNDNNAPGGKVALPSKQTLPSAISKTTLPKPVPFDDEFSTEISNQRFTMLNTGSKSTCTFDYSQFYGTFKSYDEDLGSEEYKIEFLYGTPAEYGYEMPQDVMPESLLGLEIQDAWMVGSRTKIWINTEDFSLYVPDQIILPEYESYGPILIDNSHSGFVDNCLMRIYFMATPRLPELNMWWGGEFPFDFLHSTTSILKTDNLGNASIEIPEGDYTYLADKITYSSEYSSITTTGDYTLGITLSSVFEGGDGSEAYPYLISNAEQLDYLRYLTGTQGGKSFELINDINLGVSPWNDGEGWLPIGNSSSRFNGKFDGNNYTIRNLTINRPNQDNISLFGYSSNATITNLSLEDIYVSGNIRVSGLISVPISTAIYNCNTSGYVYAQGNWAGGLVGINSGNSIISNCFSHAHITASGYSVGGLAGVNEVNSKIQNCFASGSVSGNTDVGGLVGHNSNSVISNCYSTGTVSANDLFGGFVGTEGENTSYSNNYWNIESSGLNSSIGGESRTTDDMTSTYSANTYVDWDFTSIWAEDNDYTQNNGYPYLRSPEFGPPILTTRTIFNITQTTATSGGNVIYDGGASVTARGVCWSTSENPTVADNKTENGVGVGGFTSSLTSLTATTTYYVRAYATNSEGTAYGDQVQFTTQKDATTALPLPFADSFEEDISGWSVRNDDGDDFTWELSMEDPRTGAKHLMVFLNSAGNNDWLISPLLSLPAGEPIKLSFWAKSYSTTSLESFDVKVITNDGNQIDAISSETSVPNAYTEYTYNLSSYAGMEVNIAIVCVSVDKHYLFVDDFSCEVGTAVEVPIVTTKEATSITQTTATSGGNVTNNGGAEVTARGVVWSTGTSPTLESNIGYTTDGAGDGEFVSELSGLSPETTYYVRAYATNSIGTAYGQEENFATTSTSTFTVYFSNPQMWESVYLWIWGGDGSFTPSWPGVQMNAPMDGSIWYSFDIPGSYNNLLFNAGNGPEKTIDLFRNTIGWFDGVQWYDSEPYNTQGTLSDIDGNFYRTAAIGNQIWMAQNLRVKHYNNGDAINANLNNNDWSSTGQGAYGVYPPDNVYFYSEDGMLRLYGAQYNWYAVSDGRNICPTGWRIPSNDDWDELIAHLGGASEAGGKLKTTGNIDSGTGVWVSPNTGATNEVGFLAAPSGSREYSGTYYNFSSGATFWSSTQYEYDAGYFYGLNLNYATAFAEYAIFMKNQGLSVRCVLGTSATAPTVITYSVDGITSTSAVSGGNVTSDGGVGVSARGVVWSNSPNSTLETAIGYTTDGSGTGTFQSNITNLAPSTSYYVRAYATNIIGTAYGQDVSFTTQPAGMPTLTTKGVVLQSATSASTGGVITSDGGSAITQRGVVWSTSQNPTIGSYAGITYDGSGAGGFNSSITGLAFNTRYYVRAYAQNGIGVAYGNEVNFTTANAVTFTVVNQSNSPIVGALVLLDGDEIATNASGIATFYKINGDYEYLVTANGFLDTWGSVTVSGSDVNVFIKLVTVSSNVPTITGEHNVCRGSEVIYNISGASNGTWEVSGGEVVTNTTSSITVIWTTPNSLGKISYHIMDGSYEIAYVLPININQSHMLFPGNRPVIHRKGHLNILICTSQNMRYKWHKDGINLSGETNQYIVAGSQSGEFRVQTINSNQCPHTSANESLNGKMSEELMLTVYPNPTNGNFNLLIEGELVGVGMMSIANTFGNVVHKEKIQKTTYTLEKNMNLRELMPGVYLITLKMDEYTSITTKLTIY